MVRVPAAVLIGGVFYFLLIRPQQRRAKAQQALVRSAEVGDEIVTTSGIFGTIFDIDEEDDVLTVEIAPGTRIRMVRAGIGRRITEDDEYEDYDEDDDVERRRGSSTTTTATKRTGQASSRVRSSSCE